MLDLLNSIFEECPLTCVTGKITKVTLEDREMLIFHEGEKVSRLDAHCILNDDIIIDIEAQCKVDKTIINRNLFYASRLYSTQLMEKKSYDQAKPVIIINILKENHFPEKPNDYITIGGTTDITTNIISGGTVDVTPQKILTNKQHFIFIEAQKCVKFGDPTHRLTKWMRYLRSTTDDVIQDLARNDKIFKKVLKAEKAFRGDTSKMSDYSVVEAVKAEAAIDVMQARAEAAEAKAKAAKAEAEIAEAKAEIAEAKAKAEAEVAKAKAEAAKAAAKAKLESALETAKRLLAIGISRDAVKEVTDLTDSQLASLT